MSVDREKCGLAGLMADDVARQVAEFTQDHKEFTLSDLQNIPVKGSGGKKVSDFASIEIQFRKDKPK